MKLEQKLWDNANYLKALLAQKGLILVIVKRQLHLVIKDEENTESKALLDNGVFVPPIVSTVPKGTARLRLMPSSMHQKHLETRLKSFTRG